ncbi:ABC transporter substrate-binding protein [Mesorhizobium sp. CU2]|uniref:ABC transporter substrate-binding protein n=1 Tax=unclassified Mesorhizobium TaxID=325217 RepID=UPI00112BBDBF|nr:MULTISPECIES: ABC transporter substrate-binding protein [unclassified Mesorhizobium]TPN82584.1 ABC transporter substrate-binding protein [Mesorhizobium sp. CU3]TPO12788.1 ABC transporter substrate-binding protein [Mesorhizobium sp. CU2]
MIEATRSDWLDILEHRMARGEVDRRAVLKLMGALGLTASAGALSPAWAQQKTFTLVSWGGDGTKGFEKALATPFAAAAGLEVKSDGSGPSEGAVQAQAESGKISWDVMDLEYFSSITLGKKGYLGEIDYSVVNKDKVVQGGTHKWGVAVGYNSYVLVYNKAQFGDNPPRTWADFFNVEKFPGKRTFPKWMVGMPEAALLADGVKPENLYPLDLDRAFAKIKALLPHVVSVWSSGAESQQLMRDGDAAMGTLWGTRAIIVDRDTNQDVTFDFNDAFYAPDGWGYMKNNPAGAEAANKFIAFAQDPAIQIDMLRLIGFGPANPEASAKVPDDLKRVNCTQPEHLAKMHLIDMNWYADNYGPALDKFVALVAS